jgi:hypothetical protein
VVDRAAANRFIRAAISDAHASGSSIATPSAPVGTHTRFSGIVSSVEAPRLKSQSEDNTKRDNDNDSSSSDGDLQVIDDASMSSHKREGTPPRGVVDTQTHPTTSAKRRRMTDPFAGMFPKPQVTHINIL